MKAFKVMCRECCTWKGVQWQIRGREITSADHDSIKGGGALFPFTQCDHLPLARVVKIWAFCYTADCGLQKESQA